LLSEIEKISKMMDEADIPTKNRYIAFDAGNKDEVVVAFIKDIKKPLNSENFQIVKR